MIPAFVLCSIACCVAITLPSGNSAHQKNCSKKTVTFPTNERLILTRINIGTKKIF